MDLESSTRDMKTLNWLMIILSVDLLVFFITHFMQPNQCLLLLSSKRTKSSRPSIVVSTVQFRLPLTPLIVLQAPEPSISDSHVANFHICGITNFRSEREREKERKREKENVGRIFNWSLSPSNLERSFFTRIHYSAKNL